MTKTVLATALVLAAAHTAFAADPTETASQGADRESVAVTIYNDDLALIRAMAIAAAETGKLALVDVVELNPRYDVDERTARVAARLVDDIVNAL